MGEALEQRGLPAGGQAAGGTATVPLTMAQQGIWLSEQLHPGHSGYHDIAVVGIDGPLDPAALADSLHDLMAQHEALRCRLHDGADGAPRQSFDADRLDFDHRQAGQDDPLDRTVGLDGTEPFDLATGPLWRVRLIQVAPAQHRLIVISHHLITDGWSHGVFLAGLLRNYLLRTAGSPASPASNGYSYGAWILDKVAREVTAPARLQAAAARLSDAPRRLAIPGLLPAPGDTAARSVAIPLARAGQEAFAAACRSQGMTEYAGTAAVFGYLLAQLTGSQRIVLAAPVGHRDDPRVAELLGCLVDNIAIHLELDPAAGPIAALAAGRTALGQALTYADVPYGALVRAAGVVGSGPDPLTNVSLKEYNAPLQSRRIADLTVTPLSRIGLRTRHDLALSVPSRLQQAPELLVRAAAFGPGVAENLAEELAGIMREVSAAAA